MNKYLEVFICFFKLGLISFGGPAAHIGYFQKKFVEQLRWLEQNEFAHLLSLSQFLPGPGSSQMGFAIGYKRAGHFGAWLAFLGFTLPSFILMYALAIFSANVEYATTVGALIYGLKLLAVVVVADAVLTMFTAFCRCLTTRLLAVFSTLLLVFMPTIFSQISVLFIGAAIALLIKPNQDVKGALLQVPWKKINVPALLVFVLLFVSLPLVSDRYYWLNMFSNFYHSGSLVFGGGHVVLPLLQESLQGLVATDRFITGYALAQAVPGPMFTMATFLGAELVTVQPLVGALVATLAIFLPGFLLILALQNAWQTLANNPRVANAISGVSACVVGLLISAFYQPILVSAVHTVFDVVLVCIGFYLLRYRKLAIAKLVLLFALTGFFAQGLF